MKHSSPLTAPDLRVEVGRENTGLVEKKGVFRCLQGQRKQKGLSMFIIHDELCQIVSVKLIRMQ